MSLQPEIYLMDTSNPEVWDRGIPKRGNHIRVNRGLYYHHGIYVSMMEVIHFASPSSDNVLNFSQNEIISTSLAEFLRGGTVEIRKYTDKERENLYPVEHIVHYARTCLGEGGYNLVFNNCEHFANWCTLGDFYSGQVKRVLCRGNRVKDITLGGRIMGLFGWLFGGGSKSRSSSSSTYTYEPDKVRIAEIEAANRIQLEHLERERIELINNFQKELLEKEYYYKIAHEEAKARGFIMVADYIVNIQEKLNEISEKRLEIITKGSLSLIKDVELMYQDFEHKIDTENHEYNTEKLPKLLSLLEDYEEGSTAHKLYSMKIEQEMIRQGEYISRQLDNLSIRQNKIIDGILKSKDTLLAQNTDITKGLFNQLALQIEEVKPANQLGYDKLETEALKLPNTNVMQIEHKNK